MTLHLSAAVLAFLALSARGSDSAPAKKDAQFAQARTPEEEKYDERMRALFKRCKVENDCKEYMLEKKKAGKTALEEKIESLGAGAGPVKPRASAPPRAARPARRPAAGGGASSGGVPEPSSAEQDVPPETPEIEQIEEQARVRSAASSRRAQEGAQALRRTLAPIEDERPGKEPPRPDETAAQPALSRSVADLALAERSGYADTFRSQGLKIGAGEQGRPAVFRDDGTPATAADLARLDVALGTEPKALERRPDFFAVVTRKQFSDLKRDFYARPELSRTSFKHIDMTAGRRDFQWSQSCGAISGGCNAYSRATSYRRGDFVPPETLERISEEVSQDKDDDWSEYTEEDERYAQAEDRLAAKIAAMNGRSPTLASLLAKVGDMARGVGVSLGLGEWVRSPSMSADRAAPVGSDGAAARDAGPARARARRPRGSLERPSYDSGGSAQPMPRYSLYGLAGAGVLLILLGWKRRR